MEVLEALQQSLADRGSMPLVEVGCIGLCYAEPIVSVFPPSQPGIVYGNVTPPFAAS